MLPVAVRDARVDNLHSVMLQMPQAPGMKTTHFFAGGMYCRRIEIPAGVAIVSKVHKTEHLFIGVSGQLQVAGQGPTYTLGPGDVIPSPVGTKRAVFALTDVIVMTVHKTTLTSVDGLEDELMEESENSLYDINNQPKAGVLTSGDQQCLG